MRDKQREFFETIFDTQLDPAGKIIDDQYIRIFQNNKKYTKKPLFFNNISDLLDYTTSNKVFGFNTYFNIGLTNGESGQETDLMTRTVIGIDFDALQSGEKPELTDIINSFKKIRLYYHAIVDSGNGYHVYLCIKPTDDIEKVVTVTEKLISLLEIADDNARLTTQVLRVPCTFNVKDDKKHKPVRTVHMYELDTIKRYDIDNLYQRFCTNERDKQAPKEAGNKVTQHTLSSTNMPQCIEQILSRGSTKGNRYKDLQKIVVVLRERNKSLSEIQALCKEWAYKSDYKDNLEYRAEHIYNNLKYAEMNCKGCKHYASCMNKVVVDFEYPTDHTVVTMSETHTSRLKASSRKGVKVMLANDLLIYCILKNHSDGLYRAEIEQDMTYRNTVCLSKNMLTNALKSLEENDFIDVSTIDRKKFYKIKDVSSNIELTYNISYAATYECVKGNISTEELKLYNYMRYLHNKQQREDSNALKGNLFQFNQSDLAKDLGLTQGRISQMIHNLRQELLLGVWYRQPSKNNGFDFFIYRLNY